MSIKETKKISADINLDLVESLDSYCQVTQKKRAEALRIILSSFLNKTTLHKSLLTDMLFLKRIMRFLLIVSDYGCAPNISKEAKELWKNLNRSLK